MELSRPHQPSESTGKQTRLTHVMAGSGVQPLALLGRDLRPAQTGLVELDLCELVRTCWGICTFKTIGL